RRSQQKIGWCLANQHGEAMLDDSPGSLRRHLIRPCGGKFGLRSGDVEIRDITCIETLLNKLEGFDSKIHAGSIHLDLGIKLSKLEVVLRNIGLKGQLYRAKQCHGLIRFCLRRIQLTGCPAEE